MELREALKTGLKTLVESGVPSPELAAELLLMRVLGRDRGYLYACPEVEISEEITSRYFQFVDERATGKPTQYITGHQEFWGLDLEVTPDVLIPRPETEHVVEAVIDLAQRQGFSREAPLRIVDVGAGSGCIALALAAEFPRALLFATDISRPALEVASRNAARLGMPERVTFLESDLLACFLDARAPGQDFNQGPNESFLSAFDFVVSNPPYVARDELDKVQREVREFEPQLAWGGLERGDEVYRRLIPEALAVLKPGGWLIVEIGYNMGETVPALLGEGWTQIEVRPDLAGIPRVVVARRVP
jgi:release factor glutamine methyltransferase